MMNDDTQKAFAQLFDQLAVALQQWGNRQDIAELALKNSADLAYHILEVQNSPLLPKQKTYK